MVLAIYGIKLYRFIQVVVVSLFTFRPRIILHWLLAFALAMNRIIVQRFKLFEHIFHALIKCPHTIHCCRLFGNLFWWELDDAMDDFTINCICWQCGDGLLAKCMHKSDQYYWLCVFIRFNSAHCLYFADGFVTHHMCTEHTSLQNILTGKNIPKLHYYGSIASWKARSLWFVCIANALFKYPSNQCILSMEKSSIST